MIKAQPLNTSEACKVDMVYSSLCDSDLRPGHGSDSGWAGLSDHVELWRGPARKGLCLLYVPHSEVPLIQDSRFLSKVRMPDSIAVLVDGIEVAERISKDLFLRTGQPIGIAPYNGSPSMSYLFAEEAARTAHREKKPFHVCSEVDQKGN